MSTWMWDVIGVLFAMFLIAVTLADLFVVAVIVRVIMGRFHDVRRERQAAGERDRRLRETLDDANLHGVWPGPTHNGSIHHAH